MGVAKLVTGGVKGWHKAGRGTDWRLHVPYLTATLSAKQAWTALLPACDLRHTVDSCASTRPCADMPWHPCVPQGSGGP